jgi:DnaB helicase-like protein
MLSLEEAFKSLETPVSVVESLFEVTEISGSFARGRCPFHEDEHPSFWMSLSTGRWGCRSLNCKESADEGGHPFEDFRLKRAGSIPDTSNKLVGIFVYRSQVGVPIYAKLRFFPKSFHLVSCSLAGELLYGEPIPKRVPYNWHLFDVFPGNRLYLVEGEKDVETLRGLGMRATTFGGSADWKKYFRNYLEGFEVVLIQDRDKAGDKWVERVTEDLSPTLVLRAPSPYKDVTDLLEAGRPFKDLEQVNFDRHRVILPATELGLGVMRTPLKSGVKIFDSVNFFREKCFALIAGRPNVGKSSMLCQLILSIAERNCVLVLPYEEDAATFQKRIYIQRGLMGSIDEPLPKLDLPQLKNIFFIDNPPKRVSRIAPLLEQAYKEHPFRVIFLDHLQELNTGTFGGYQSMNEVLDLLVEWTRQKNVAIIAAAQLHRVQDPSKSPTIADLRESGCTEERVQSIALLHQLSSGKVQIHIGKNRYGRKFDTHVVKYQGEKMRFIFDE